MEPEYLENSKVIKALYKIVQVSLFLLTEGPEIVKSKVQRGLLLTS